MLEQLAAGQVGLATVWLLGLSMGLTACTVSCLPFIGTWALGRASGPQEALLHTGVFLAGRVATYTLLAALAGAAGLGLAKAMGGSWGNGVIGVASIGAAIWLLAGRASRSCQGRRRQAAVPLYFHRRRDSLPPLFFGAALSLTPCTPLATLLLLAANTGSAAQGAGYGLAFGLGAALTPIIVLVPLAGRLGRELRVGRVWLGRWLRWGGAGVLVTLGVRRLLLLAG